MKTLHKWSTRSLGQSREGTRRGQVDNEQITEFEGDGIRCLRKDYTVKVVFKGLRVYISVIECLPGLCETMGSILSMAK